MGAVVLRRMGRGLDWGRRYRDHLSYWSLAGRCDWEASSLFGYRGFPFTHGNLILSPLWDSLRCGYGLRLRGCPSGPVGVGRDGLEFAPSALSPFFVLTWGSRFRWSLHPRLGFAVAPLALDAAFGVAAQWYGDGCSARSLRFLGTGTKHTISGIGASRG